MILLSKEELDELPAPRIVPDYLAAPSCFLSDQWPFPALDRPFERFLLWSIATRGVAKTADSLGEPAANIDRIYVLLKEKASLDC